MYKFGLKLWSTNKNYFNDAEKFYNQGIYDFIELYAVPGSFNETIEKWKKLSAPFVIHAPHNGHKLNLADFSLYDDNLLKLNDTFRFADALGADKIVVHSGVEGSVDSVIDQLNRINDKRIIIENKPLYGIGMELKCRGYSIEEIKLIMENTSVGFCLDIGHSIASANALTIDPFHMISEFVKMGPVLYHLSDGLFAALTDSHLHFGNGDYPIKEILTYIPDGSLLCLETAKDSLDSLNDFAKDVEYIKLSL